MKNTLEIFFAVLIWEICTVLAVYAAQPLTKVIMTTGSFSEREAAMYVAQDQGFFRRYGLELTFVQVRNGPVGMAAIASGETQLHEGSATGAVLGAAAEGVDLVFVAGMINKLIGNIMASPKIKSPADLKGKVIAVTSASGGSWMFTTLASDLLPSQKVTTQRSVERITCRLVRISPLSSITTPLPVESGLSCLPSGERNGIGLCVLSFLAISASALASAAACSGER